MSLSQPMNVVERWTPPSRTWVRVPSLAISLDSSDHHPILIKTDVGVARDETISGTIWLWDRADWASMRRDLQHTDWDVILTGSADDKARVFTELIKSIQQLHVPHRRYATKPIDQPWFGYRCPVAAEKKYSG